MLELAPFSRRKVRNASNVGYGIRFELRTLPYPVPDMGQGNVIEKTLPGGRVLGPLWWTKGDLELSRVATALRVTLEIYD